MRLIEGVPARKILEPIIVLSKDKSPREIEDFVRSYYKEDWFDDVTGSLTGSDNALRHTIRAVRSNLGITIKD